MSVSNTVTQADELLKLLREEKELLGEHTQALKNQRDSQSLLLKKVRFILILLISLNELWNCGDFQDIACTSLLSS